ncbi:endo alpha-1,4 polygalactosaminidase [Microbacterium dextranolyticum]|uniref:endo alpha-1,4 polygalactosaminidase n=1 Tax=Microbacterium dextranolyticum TaxID=36806 RepID=UPI001956F58D|nr:endo alpha-1,4 polygalactosaminidase [Microbacterium dextranolyticum]MBM7463526.1 hypothetical protein [Microbacterium dextranolyticum]
MRPPVAPRRRSRSVTVALVGIFLVTGCAATTTNGESAPPPASATATSPATSSPGDVTLPPAGAGFDYQLGGAYAPPPGVTVVARDRTAPPAAGTYGICYVNAFQTQPGEASSWPFDLLLTDASSHPVVDPGWPDEVIVDSRKSDRVAAVVTPWIHGCADAGYRAVEFDNLDTYTRTGGTLTRDDNLRLARLLVTAAHRAGLAAAQKNAAEDAPLLHDQAGFDFAVAEECAAHDECAAYTDVYGAHVLAIEYPDTLDAPLAEVCARADRPASLILRDRMLVAPGTPGYRYETCR